MLAQEKDKSLNGYFRIARLVSAALQGEQLASC
jgi:hypothetical protein